MIIIIIIIIINNENIENNCKNYNELILIWILMIIKKSIILKISKLMILYPL